MVQAKEGDTVKVHYTGKLTNGIAFDSSAGADPLEFKIGSGRLIPGFEEAVVGMSPENPRLRPSRQRRRTGNIKRTA